MLPKKKRRILTRMERLSEKLIDLKRELDDQRFPANTPIQKDVAKIKVYLFDMFDCLDLSIQMRDDHVLKTAESGNEEVKDES